MEYKEVTTGLWRNVVWKGDNGGKNTGYLVLFSLPTMFYTLSRSNTICVSHINPFQTSPGFYVSAA